MADQKLRAVPPAAEAKTSAAEAETSDSRRSGRWIPIVLGALLALTLVLLIWSRMELGDRVQEISELQRDVRGLQEAVVQRDTLIQAQESRLSDVRGAVRSLLQLLDEPVGDAPAP